MKHPKYVTVKYIYITDSGGYKAGSYAFPYDCSHTMDCNVQHAIDFIHLHHSDYCVRSVVLQY